MQAAFLLHRQKTVFDNLQLPRNQIAHAEQLKNNKQLPQNSSDEYLLHKRGYDTKLLCGNNISLLKTVEIISKGI